PMDQKHKEEQAWQVLRNREDAAAFEEIGNTWSRVFGPAYQQNPRETLRRAIRAYQEALRFRPPQTAPLLYARTQNNLGAAYANLAAHEDPQGNLKKAIEAYHKALEFYTPQTAPLLYAMTQHELGEAWWRRAAFEPDPARRCAHLREAIRAFQEALRFRTLETTPLGHEQTRTALEKVQQQARAWGCPEEPTSERVR
ncbi:MAG: tetratricopeptide repeat protein, partial [Anaerolineae bacterium]